MTDVTDLLTMANDSPVFDEPALREITEAAGMTPMELLDMFFEDTDANIVEMATALEVGDRTAFNRAAHSLKSSAGNVGALRVALAAQALEKSTKQALQDNTSSLLETFKAHYTAFREVIAERSSSLSA